ncbi:MAG: helix-turn-helix transcriptional regulator [Dysgonamonadaceae bacterium]|jgi:DNA-binding Xre family transcriptional regulator|nr:helix-turn-helix transcriptional regulator [Dysgonamonadaceae bacterium]
MPESQKNIIERLLKEKKKTKRELAKCLNIKENSINRTIKNPNISIRRLEKIAEFLEIKLSDILEMKNSSTMQEELAEYKLLKDITKNKLNGNPINVDDLSELIKTQTRTIEMMAEIEKTNSKNIENLVNLIVNKYSDK